MMYFAVNFVALLYCYYHHILSLYF